MKPLMPGLARASKRLSWGSIVLAVAGLMLELFLMAGTAYYIGPAYLRNGWSSMDTEEVLQAIYFAGPFGGTGSALHSVAPVVALLVLYRVFHLERRDRRKILLWFLLS